MQQLISCLINQIKQIDQNLISNNFILQILSFQMNEKLITNQLPFPKYFNGQQWNTKITNNRKSIPFYLHQDLPKLKYQLLREQFKSISEFQCPKLQYFSKSLGKIQSHNKSPRHQDNSSSKKTEKKKLNQQKRSLIQALQYGILTADRNSNVLLKLVQKAQQYDSKAEQYGSKVEDSNTQKYHQKNSVFTEQFKKIEKKVILSERKMAKKHQCKLPILSSMNEGQSPPKANKTNSKSQSLQFKQCQRNAQNSSIKQFGKSMVLSQNNKLSIMNNFNKISINSADFTQKIQEQSNSLAVKHSSIHQQGNKIKNLTLKSNKNSQTKKLFPLIQGLDSSNKFQGGLKNNLTHIQDQQERVDKAYIKFKKQEKKQKQSIQTFHNSNVSNAEGILSQNKINQKQRYALSSIDKLIIAKKQYDLLNLFQNLQKPSRLSPALKKSERVEKQKTKQKELSPQTHKNSSIIDFKTLNSSIETQGSPILNDKEYRKMKQQRKFKGQELFLIEPELQLNKSLKLLSPQQQNLSRNQSVASSIQKQSALQARRKSVEDSNLVTINGKNFNNIQKQKQIIKQNQKHKGRQQKQSYALQLHSMKYFSNTIHFVFKHHKLQLEKELKQMQDKLQFGEYQQDEKKQIKSVNNDKNKKLLFSQELIKDKIMANDKERMKAISQVINSIKLKQFQS